MPRIISIVNQKGGVGKTTTAVNLATALAAIHKKVLLIDLDPQGNASTGLGVPFDQRKNGVYKYLLGHNTLSDSCYQTMIPGLSVLSSSPELSGAEVELVNVEKREYYLKNALNKDTQDIDVILIDCPPALGLLTLNALVASHYVLIPLQCEYYALEGLSHLVKTLKRVKSVLNKNLDILGIVLTMYDQRNRLCQQVEQDVRNYFGKLVYETVIPRNVRVSEAPSHGKPVLLYDMRCVGSQAYIRLACELLKNDRKE